MPNENVLSPDDSRFELPDVDSLLDVEPSVDDDSQQDVTSQESNETKPEFDVYGDVIDSPDSNEPDSPVTDTNVLYQFLQNHGITDPSKINWEDEDGNETEVDFANLSIEDQLGIIDELSKPDITDEEIQTIDYLRRNNMTLSQVIDHFANERLQQYIAEHGDPSNVYTIDEYTDEQLYLADLKSKYPNFTDDKLNAKLEAAKANEELFAEEVSELRTYYKDQEQKQLDAQKEADAASQKQYTDTLYSAVNSFNEIALDYTDPESDTLEIEQDDKKRILSYLLDTDAEGKTQFVKDIENPDALIELAYLRTAGADMLSNVTKYWKETLKTERKESARLRKQLEKDKSNNSIVQTPREKSSNSSSSPWDNSGLF